MYAKEARAMIGNIDSKIFESSQRTTETTSRSTASSTGAQFSSTPAISVLHSGSGNKHPIEPQFKDIELQSMS